MTQVMSVDLGTTFSAAAVGDGTRIEIFSLGARTPIVPSVVALRPDGAVLVGEAAERRAVSEPTRVAREFKRRLGDPVPIVIGGTPYGAEALMGHLLRWIVDRVTEQEGAVPQRIVLTHPASYGPYKLDLLQQVGHLAEVGPVELLTEPEAAAVHYSRQERIEPGEVVAVYDLGGGTFDAALVRRTEEGFELIGTPDGMDRFGGIDLDEAVFAHVRSSLGQAIDSLDPHDPAVTTALARLRDDCCQAKESLSSDTEAVIPVMLPNLHTEVRITRAELEDMVRPRLRETLAALDRLVRSADLRWSDVSRVLLVGGSSRIPLVAEMVRAHTGRPTALDAHPKHAIALGAVAAAMAGATGSVAAVAAEPPARPVTSAAAAGEATAGLSPVEPLPGVTEPHERRNRRRPSGMVLGVVGAVLLALVGLVGFLLLGGDGREAAAPPDASAPDGTGPTVTQPDGTDPAVTQPTDEPGETELAPVEGPPPSERVLALYRAGYGSADGGGAWNGWADAPDAAPPVDIASDFYPVLGPYDSTSPPVVAQHLAWLRRAGIGGILVPWNGDDSAVGDAVTLLLDIGERYEIRLALVVQMEGATPEDGVVRVEQALARFGEHPQYLRVTAADRDQRTSARPLLVIAPPPGVENPEAWAATVEVIRGMGDGVAVVVASNEQPWVELTPADGLLGGPAGEGAYSWAPDLPPGVWYLPAIRPGVSVERLGRPDQEDRGQGASFERSWQLARDAGDPTFFVVDSFNEWSGGTQIEPATADVPERATVPYRTYEPLPPEGYLELTRALVDTSAR
jgi:actin-like ATPase involved in cell morphogenesis